MAELPRKRYSQEFKIEAVRQITEKGRSPRDVSQALGVNETLLHKWRRKLELGEETGMRAGLRKSSPMDAADRVKQLEKELADARADNEILKKAAAYFAKHQS